LASTEKTTGTDSYEVGRVAYIYDDVKAVSADGMERQLSIESAIFAHDRIIIEGYNRVSIVIHDDSQTQIDLVGMNDVIIDEDIFGGVSSEEIAGAAAEVEEVQKAFFIQDIDLTAEPETVATDSVASAGGSHTPADLERTTHEDDLFNTGDKISIIFDQNDYSDLDHGTPVDPLDNLIDTYDSTS